MHKKVWFLIGFVTGAAGRCREAEAAPARPEHGPIFSSLVKAIRKGMCNGEFYKIIFLGEVRLITFIVIQVSLTRLHSLCSMQRERSKRNTRGGMSPTSPLHGTSAAGSGEARWHPFGEPSQTRPLTRSQTHGKVRFLCCGTKNPLTSHAKGKCYAALAFHQQLR